MIKDADINQRIHNVYMRLSKGHKKIANAILYNHEKTAYMTAERLANFADVSESTVIRFANELGYEGYAEFQRASQELVRTKLTPNQRIELSKQMMQGSDITDKVMSSDISKIRRTFEQLDRLTFSSAVSSILCAKNIYIIGARSAETLALLLKYNLSLIFDNVKFIQPNSTAEVFEQMFTIGEGDVLIAFSFPRYSSKVVSAVKYAKQRSARVIVITDSSLSPLAEHATYLLLAESDMASYMDSLVAPMSLINAIIIEITNRRERTIRDRFDRLEQVWEEYGVFTKRQ